MVLFSKAQRDRLHEASEGPPETPEEADSRIKGLEQQVWKATDALRKVVQAGGYGDPKARKVGKRLMALEKAIAALKRQKGQLLSTDIRSKVLEFVPESESQGKTTAQIAAEMKTDSNRVGAVLAQLEKKGVVRSILSKSSVRTDPGEYFGRSASRVVKNRLWWKTSQGTATTGRTEVP